MSKFMYTRNILICSEIPHDHVMVNHGAEMTKLCIKELYEIYWTTIYGLVMRETIAAINMF